MAQTTNWREVYKVKKKDTMEKTFYIIDDHEMLRTGTASYIESHSGWKCRGNSGEGDAALAEFAQLAAAGA